MAPGLRLLAYLLVLAALAAASGWFLWRVQSSLQSAPGADAPLLKLRQLRATRYDLQGLPHYTLQAPYSEHLAGDRGSRLQRPTLELYHPDRAPAWSLRAGTGWLAADGRLLRLSNGVELERWYDATARPLNVRSQSLNYRPAERLISGEQPVTVDSLDGRLRGVGLRYWLDDDQLELLNDVTTRYLPPSG